MKSQSAPDIIARLAAEKTIADIYIIALDSQANAESLSEFIEKLKTYKNQFSQNISNQEK